MASTGPLSALIARARPLADDPPAALAVLADYLQESDDPLGERLAVLTADPQLTFIGVERYECPNTVEGQLGFDVPVFRFEPFADAVGLPPDHRAPDTELALLPPVGRSEWPGAPFLIARTTATERVFGATRGARGLTGHQGPMLPAHKISINDAIRWCGSLGLRLPTEMHWEFACRGYARTPYCFGDIADPAQIRHAHQEPVEVATLPPNAFGLFEMHGNMHEWILTPQQEASLTRVRYLKSGLIVRGGCFRSKASACRSSARLSMPRVLAWSDEDYVGIRPIHLLGATIDPSMWEDHDESLLSRVLTQLRQRI